ncbi:putative 2Fe-2S iron-sulfur cluster binding protein [Escherichia coli]|nr:putative 2Fe-2S iron-sulfur cluster binding protein [Escherichia coli]
MVTLTRLFIHPVKSMRGIGLTHALADVSGLAFDRIFMITEPDGTFITARQFPQMVRFTPSPVHDGLHLTAPDGSSAYVRFADFATQDAPTEVWGHTFYRANCARRDQQMAKWIFLPRSAITLGGATNDPARETPQHCTPVIC